MNKKFRFSLKYFMLFLILGSIVFAIGYQWATKSKREYFRKQASLTRVGELRGGVLYEPRVSTTDSDPYDLGTLLELHFEETAVTDDDLEHVAVLEPTKLLCLKNTKISDRGLVHLHGLDIETIDLTDTEVTAQGIVCLKSSLSKTSTIVQNAPGGD